MAYVLDRSIITFSSSAAIDIGVEFPGRLQHHNQATLTVTLFSCLSLLDAHTALHRAFLPRCRVAAVQLANELIVFGSDCTLIKWPLTANDVGVTRKCCSNLEILSVLHTAVSFTLFLPLLVQTAGCPPAETVMTMS